MIRLKPLPDCQECDTSWQPGSLAVWRRLECCVALSGNLEGVRAVPDGQPWCQLGVIVVGNCGTGAAFLAALQRLDRFQRTMLSRRERLRQ